MRLTCQRCGTRWTGEQPCPDCRLLRIAEQIAMIQAAEAGHGVVCPNV